MAEISLKIFMGTMLLICGIQDAFKKKIFLWMILSGGIVTGLWSLFCSDLGLWNRISGAGIGGFVILISMVTSGKIGLGDGMLLCITGLGLGFWGNLELFCLALSLAAGLSILLLIFRLTDRKKSIPFVPFLFAGYLILSISRLNIY